VPGKFDKDRIRLDMRAGANNAALMEKYHLSESELKGVLQEIIDDQFKIGSEADSPRSAGLTKDHSFPTFDPKTLMFGKWGALGGAIGASLSELFLSHAPAYSLLEAVFDSAMWFAFAGIGISTFMFLSQDRYLRKPFAINTSVSGSLSGLIAGFPSGAIAQFTYSVIGPTELPRIICWSLAGGLLAFFLAKRIPNLDRKKAAIGGSVGGAIGGMAFIVMAVAGSSVLGRLVGETAIGFCIGIMVAVTETLTRAQWVEIRWPDNRTSNLSLGERPITLGSGQDCDIRDTSLPRLLGKIRILGGVVKYEESSGNRVVELQEGQSLDLGNLSVTLRKSAPLAFFGRQSN